MENSSTPFTDLLNSTPNSNSQNRQDNPPHIPGYSPPTNLPPPHYGYHPQHPHNFMSFGGQGSYQHFPGAQPSYHQLMSGMPSGSHLGAPYQGGFGQYPQGFVGGAMLGGPSSSAGSGAVFGAAGGSSSRGDESGSPMSASPMSAAQYIHQQGVTIDDDSDGGEEPRGGRQKWGKHQNLRLVSAWLKHSIDPIHGNNKRSDHYWKQVADEFNKHSCKAERIPVQCKNHWNRTSTMVAKFNAAFISMSRVYASGQSEKQLIDKAQEEYKRMMSTDKPFALEYSWSEVKDHAKWKNSYGFGDMNKRNKVNSSGAYTSSNQDSNQDSDDAQDERTIGRTAAKMAEKEERKNKEKKTSSRSKLNETVVQFNDLALRKSEAIEKMAAAAQVHARMWHKKTLARIMYACIILHNMIVEDERDTYQVRYDIDYYNEYEQSGHSPQLSGFGHGPIHEFSTVLEIGQAIRNQGMHQKLKNDLVEHIWQKFGGEEA